MIGDKIMDKAWCFETHSLIAVDFLGTLFLHYNGKKDTSNNEN